jgi:hypothetical protein
LTAQSLILEINMISKKEKHDAKARHCHPAPDPSVGSRGDWLAISTCGLALPRLARSAGGD